MPLLREHPRRMTPAEFKALRRKLGLTQRQLAQILNAGDRAVRQWEAEDGDRGSRAIAVRVMWWLAHEPLQPPEWPDAEGVVRAVRATMTPAEFKAARRKLGLRQWQLAWILANDERTVRKWEAGGGTNARGPNRMAVRVMGWLADGFRPREWQPSWPNAAPGDQGDDA